MRNRPASLSRRNERYVETVKRVRGIRKASQRVGQPALLCVVSSECCVSLLSFSLFVASPTSGQTSAAASDFLTSLCSDTCPYTKDSTDDHAARQSHCVSQQGSRPTSCGRGYRCPPIQLVASSIGHAQRTREPCQVGQEYRKGRQLRSASRILAPASPSPEGWAPFLASQSAAAILERGPARRS